jgi:hypothetical protein
MHRFRAKNPAHGFLQRASAGGKHKDAHHSDAAEVTAPALADSGNGWVRPLLRHG